MFGLSVNLKIKENNFSSQNRVTLKHQKISTRLQLGDNSLFKIVTRSLYNCLDTTPNSDACHLHRVSGKILKHIHDLGHQLGPDVAARAVVVFLSRTLHITLHRITIGEVRPESGADEIVVLSYPVLTQSEDLTRNPILCHTLCLPVAILFNQ